MHFKKFTFSCHILWCNKFCCLMHLFYFQFLDICVFFSFFFLSIFTVSKKKLKKKVLCFLRFHRSLKGFQISKKKKSYFKVPQNEKLGVHSVFFKNLRLLTLVLFFLVILVICVFCCIIKVTLFTEKKKMKHKCKPFDRYVWGITVIWKK